MASKLYIEYTGKYEDRLVFEATPGSKEFTITKCTKDGEDSIFEGEDIFELFTLLQYIGMTIAVNTAAPEKEKSKGISTPYDQSAGYR